MIHPDDTRELAQSANDALVKLSNHMRAQNDQREYSVNRIIHMFWDLPPFPITAQAKPEKDAK